MKKGKKTSKKGTWFLILALMGIIAIMYLKKYEVEDLIWSIGIFAIVAAISVIATILPKVKLRLSFFGTVWFLIIFVIGPLFIFLAYKSAPVMVAAEANDSKHFIPDSAPPSPSSVPETSSYSPSYSSSETPTSALQCLEQDYVVGLIDYWSDYYGADRDLMVRIAECESDLIPWAKNPGWGATDTGVFQFIKSTWETYCEGDPYNANDNIRCAAMLIANGEINHWYASKACWN